MPLGSAEIEQIGTYVRANLAEWMEDIVGPRLLGRTARVEDELTFQRELISSRFEAVDKRFEEMLHRFDPSTSGSRTCTRSRWSATPWESIPGSSSGWPTAIRASAATASPSIRGSSCTRRQSERR